MTKPPQPQSQKRFNESVAALFEGSVRESSMVFIKSSSDIGVRRNGGRNGARFAPQSLLATFKKLALTDALKKIQLSEYETAAPSEELENFHTAQDLQADRIKMVLKNHPGSPVCHLGGGHDHIYPFLKAASSDYKKVLVLNIDAHADTRDDEEFHSGTPFRQLAKTKNLVLFQYGLHPFANSESTLKNPMRILWRPELANPEKRAEFLNAFKQEIDANTLVVFSLDADALSAAEMPGVSAVNSDGLTLQELKEVWKFFKTSGFTHAPMIGIYELNPMYDTLSAISMRTISNFLFEVLS